MNYKELWETTLSLGGDRFSKHKYKEGNFEEKTDQFFSINIKICVLKLTINQVKEAIKVENIGHIYEK